MNTDGAADSAAASKVAGAFRREDRESDDGEQGQRQDRHKRCGPQAAPRVDRHDELFVAEAKPVAVSQPLTLNGHAVDPCAVRGSGVDDRPASIRLEQHLGVVAAR